MSNSSNIPNDVWYKIGSKLTSLHDRMRFRAVCKLWRSLLPGFCHLPCLMLPESGVYNEDEQLPQPPLRRFMCLGKQQIHELDFSEIHQAHCIGSAGTWLITVHNDINIRLINLFSRAQIHLPDDNLTEGGGWELRKIVLSSSPCNGPNCVAMAIHHNGRRLAVARPGDESWTTVQTDDILTEASLFIEDIISYKQQFYAVNWCGRLIVCNIGDDLYRSRLSCITDPFNECCSDESYYLVECFGELLVVIKIEHSFKDRGNGPTIYLTHRFEVHRLDFTNMKFNELKSLGEHALFLGPNSTSVSVLASDYFGLVEQNCIYFIDGLEQSEFGPEASYCMRVFDLENKRIRPGSKQISSSFYAPPVWIVPPKQ